MTPTHRYHPAIGRGEKVELLRLVIGGESARILLGSGKTKTVPVATLTPLERTAPPPGEITREFTVERLDEPVRAVPKSPPVRSRSYLAWIRTQPCAWSLDGVRPREASHHPEPMHGSKAAKCSDHRVLPLLPDYHRQFTDTQAIGHLEADETKAWVEAEIAAHLTRYLREECGWTGREINTRIVRLLSEMVDESAAKKRRAG